MWLGLLARGAVFVKLTLPDGSSKATLDCSINVADKQQQQASEQPSCQPVAGVLGWYGKTFHIGVQHLIKVSFPEQWLASLTPLMLCRVM
jgi:hypothetical protein